MKPLFTIDAFGLTDVGRVRTNNEDSFCALVKNYDSSYPSALLAVADGIGGRPSGELASSMVTYNLENQFETFFYEESFTGDSDPGEVRKKMEYLFHQLNRDILERNTDDVQEKRMGTTLTAGMILGAKLYLTHTGDSRAYIVRENAIQQLTQDHTYVADQVRRGIISAEEAKVSPHRHMITSSLGTSVEMQIDHLQVGLEHGDIIIFSSDGLTDMVHEQELRQIIAATSDLRAAAYMMIDLANQRGGRDNSTVVIVRIEYRNKKKRTPSRVRAASTPHRLAIKSLLVLIPIVTIVLGYLIIGPPPKPDITLIAKSRNMPFIMIYNDERKNLSNNPVSAEGFDEVRFLPENKRSPYTLTITFETLGKKDSYVQFFGKLNQDRFPKIFNRLKKDESRIDVRGDSVVGFFNAQISKLSGFFDSPVVCERITGPLTLRIKKQESIKKIRIDFRKAR